MIIHLLKRAFEVIKRDGIGGYIKHIKKCIYNKLLIDEIWYMINYYCYRSHKVIRRVQNSKMELDLTDGGINRDLFLHRVREPECTRIYQKELREGMNIVDVGANIGYYVLIESGIVGKSGKIYAIEPALKNFELLKKNVEINSYPVPVSFYNIAMSDKIGKIKFFLSDVSNHHRLSRPGDLESDVVEVNTSTLDELFKDKKIDVIRMDPEGAEWVIVKGMSQILDSNRSLRIFMEVHPKLISNYGGNIEAMLNIFVKAGFRLRYIVLWKPNSHYLIPYLKGREALEKSLEYNIKLEEALLIKETRDILLCASGHPYEAGYKIFMER